MVLCTKAHDVESGGSVGEKHVVQRAIAFVFVTEIKVIGVVVERYFGSGILCRGYNLVERDGCSHVFSFGPVVSVGCQRWELTAPGWLVELCSSYAIRNR